MLRQYRDYLLPWFMMVLGTGFSLFGTFRFLAYPSAWGSASGGKALLLSLLGLIAMVAGYAVWQLKETRDHLHWLTAQAIWSRDRLQTHGLHLTPEAKADGGPRSETHWPWGRHHTELLGHLEAAARKWWVNYDPESPDTAPTNEIVSAWLVEERRVSKDKAKAIASILRVDGLRTGPR